MTNKEIASLFNQTAKILELHGDNPFKIKGYQSAAFNLEKYNETLSSLSGNELEALEGINKKTATKIVEIATTGCFTELQNLLDNTPLGVIELLEIPGIGPKKVRSIWKDLGIESKNTLKEACKKDEIANLKGFGNKTQQTILKGLEFLEQQSGKFLFAEIESYSKSIIDLIQVHNKDIKIELVGQAARKLETIDLLEYLIQSNSSAKFNALLDSVPVFLKDTINSSPFIWRGQDTQAGILLEFRMTPQNKFTEQKLIQTASINHLRLLHEGAPLMKHIKNSTFESEEAFYNNIGLHYVIPEAREGYREQTLDLNNPLPDIIENHHIKGALHNHSTYSDGKNTILEMAEACIERGYQYFGISDHSVTASYAGGLDIDRVLQQQREIDKINTSFKNFKVFKGIESDILNDGSLDYEEEILKSFDYIVSSIHANLKMDINTATNRLLKAIENPFTTMLGHATGRLLLKRDGYPIDFKKIIDACSDNGVIIEINANPRRLDIDWRWMDYILSKNVMLSINPDAHVTTGLDDIQYGVNVARKALVPKEMIFNTKTTEEVDAYFKSKKK